MEERKQEPNWTELLEKEVKSDPVCWQLVERWRAEGQTDKEIYEFLESFG